MKTITFTLACAALALAACGKGDAGKSADAGTAAAPKTATPAGMPSRKAGLWTNTITMAETGASPISMTLCVDPTTDAKMSAIGSQTDPTKCSAYKVDHGADGSVTFHSVCDMGTGGVTTSTGTITGDFNSEYTAKFDSETTGASVPQMNRKSSVTMTAK